MLSRIWRFIMQEAQEFLDCEILTKTGTLVTNKCFLCLSGVFRPILKQCDQDKLVVFMPNHTSTEIQEELLGFVKNDKILNYQSVCETREDNAQWGSQIVRTH